MVKSAKHPLTKCKNLGTALQTLITLHLPPPIITTTLVSHSQPIPTILLSLLKTFSSRKRQTTGGHIGHTQDNSHSPTPHNCAMSWLLSLFTCGFKWRTSKNCLARSSSFSLVCVLEARACWTALMYRHLCRVRECGRSRIVVTPL